MKRLALIGKNLGYSLSKDIHTLVFEHMGIDASYTIISLNSDELKSSREMLESYDGFNVTQPHKTAILDFCSENRSEFDAVNTVVNADGKFIAYNTDYYGFLKSISEKIDIKDKSVLVMGAGGVAKVIVPALVNNGAKVTITNRTKESGQRLAERYGCGFSLSKKGSYDIIINCTSVGLNDGDDASIGLELEKTQLVYDTIYLKTKLMDKARKIGIQVIDGLKMLIYQAIRADEIFFDTKIDNQEELADKIASIITSKE